MAFKTWEEARAEAQHRESDLPQCPGCEKPVFPGDAERVVPEWFDGRPAHFHAKCYDESSWDIYDAPTDTLQPQNPTEDTP
jgi:hypothetical protein